MEEQYKFEIKDLDLFYGRYQALHKISMNIRTDRPLRLRKINVSEDTEPDE